MLVHYFHSVVPQRRREGGREPVHAPGDGPQSLRSVIRGVETGNDREQDLRGADVARGLLAPDVLLACLQREPERGAPLRIDRDTDETPGKRAPMLVAHREIRRVRTAESQRYAEALRRADDRVGAHLARRCHEREREQVGGNAHQRTARVRAFDCRREVVEPTTTPGVLHQHREASVDQVGRVGVADDDLDPERRRARTHDVDRLRMRVGIDEEHTALLRVDPVEHRHGLRGRGALVEERRVREVHAGEVAHHRLEVQQRLEPALTDLGLVGRVRGVPSRVLEHVAQDHGGRDRVVVAEPDERREHLVAAGELPQPRERSGFGKRLGQVEGSRFADHSRHRGVDELIQRPVTQDREHRGLVAGARTDVPVDERIQSRILSGQLVGHGGNPLVPRIGCEPRTARLPLCRGTPELPDSDGSGA